jgi:Icc-related predicted phosphoesterase
MKILGLSDQVNDVVYSSHVRDHFNDVDLIVGCGDLPADYLEFVVSMLDVPLVYVPGNHDVDDYSVPGGIDVDGKVVRIGDLRIAGLGGSRRYKNEGDHQYTENEMRVRVIRLIFAEYLKALLRRPRLDIFVTHSPPRGIHDAPDFAHQGFQSFHPILEFLKPSIMLHGHSHVHRNIECTESTVSGSKIINVYPYRVIDYLGLQ